jgi:hypothetical protein
VYLKGGTKVKGLGSLLGNSLALLYVARHGLKDTELFDLLVRIMEEDEWTKSTAGTEADAEMKIMKELSHHKTRLIDVFRQFDADGNNLLSHSEFRKGIEKLHLKSVSKDQIEMIINSLDKNHDGVIDFDEAMGRFEQHARDWSHGKHRINPDDNSSLESGSQISKKSVVAGLDMDFLNDSSVDVSKSQEKTLGSAVETALRKALINLGVIYAPANGILMLPLESEALREVVWWRYMKSMEGQLKWHAHLIQFFQELMPSLRRCEELPWHLRKCRRWTMLKDTLVDLRTFDIMYDNDDDIDYNANGALSGVWKEKIKLYRKNLSKELFNYWKNLIEGPLYVSDEDQEKGYKSQIEFASHSQQLLEELDTSSKLGLTDSQIRKERLRGQMAPFDIVDEYNKAVEIWHSGTSPNTIRLNKMIVMIAQFMAWFSKLINNCSEPPPFLRKTMKFEQLNDVGVDQEEILGLKKAKVSNGGEDDFGAEEKKEAPEQHIGKAPLVKFSPEKYNIGGKGMKKPDYYYFNRWLWIQFPWLSLGNAKKYSSQMLMIDNAGPTAPKPERKGSLISLDFDEEGLMGLDNQLSLDSKKSDVSKSKNQRFWDVKKVDPRADPKGNASNSRVNSMIAVEAGRVSAANRMFDRIDEENRVLGIAPRTKIKPSRMSIEPTEKPKDKSEESIPFAYSSVKSVKRGSRFPSVEKFHKKQIEEIESKRDFAEKKAIEILVSKEHRGKDHPKTLVEYVDAAQAEETPFSASNGGDMGYLPAHSMTFPATNDDALLAQAFAKAGKMREIFDKLKLESKVKAEKLENMQRSVNERERKDELVHKNMLAGEEIMSLLSEKLVHMDSTLKNAKYLGEFYVRIQEVLLSNPAKDKNHLDALEQQLNLARQQLADMLKRRNALRVEKNFIEKTEKPRIREEIEKIRENKEKKTREITKMRKEVARRKAEHDERRGLGKGNTLDSLFRSSTSKSELERAEVVEGGGSAQNSRPASSGAPVKLGFSALTPSKALQTSALGGLASLSSAMVQEADGYKSGLVVAAMERLEEATGTTDGDELVEKLKQSSRLGLKLKDDKKIVEHQAQVLKKELADLKEELDKLQFAGEDGAGEKEVTTDVRKLDEITNKKEMDCIQARKRVERTANLLHLVQTGIMHLKRITDETDEAYELPATKVHSHILDEEGINEHVKVLARTEDRLTGVIEALTLGSSKQLGDDRSLSIAQKQTEIAEAVHRANMKRLGEEKAKKYRPTSRGGALEEKTRPQPNTTQSLSSPTAIKIKVLSQLDQEYDNETESLLKKQDRKQDLDEAEIIAAADDDAGKEEIVKFINEALHTRESMREQRKAHVLSESKTGNHKDMGITMDTVLFQQEERLANAGPAALLTIKKGIHSPRSSIAVHDRDELKKHARKLQRAGEKEIAKEEAAKKRALELAMAG